MNYGKIELMNLKNYNSLQKIKVNRKYVKDYINFQLLQNQIAKN